MRRADDRKPEVEPLPPLLPNTVFVYTASDLADPFDADNLKDKSAESDTAKGEEGPDPSRRKEPLEAFPLDALKLVGVLAQNGIDWAIIRAPDQVVHRVTEGNYMGENDGEIVLVEDHAVTVHELIRNPVGKWEKSEVEIILVE